jgi:TRAP-type C4-dicarboxylate transport system permease small subunit
MRSVLCLFAKLTRGMHLLSGLVLIAMMFVTLADVVARFVFDVTDGQVDFTFIGGVELIKYGLLIVVFFVLPNAVGRSQVFVDLFTERFPTQWNQSLDGLYQLGFMLLGFGMCYQFYHAIGEVNMTGETTQDLFIPLTYFYAITCFASGVLSIAALINAVKLISAVEQEAH